MAKNKIIYNGNTLIDLTGDTVTADKLMQGYTAHDRSGAVITGTASGGSATIQPLSVTQNGTYTAPSGVDGYSPVTVNVSGGGGQYAWLGENAEKVGTVINKTINLKDDTSYDSWTASTSASTILSASTNPDYTFTADLINYDYYFVTKGIMDVVYLAGTPMTSTVKRVCEYEIYMLTGYPNVNNYANVSTDSANTFTVQSSAIWKTISYYNSAGTIASRGANFGPLYYSASPSIQNIFSVSGTSVTYKLPAFYAKCDSSRFTTARKEQVDSANTNFYYTVDVYRVPHGKTWMSYLTSEMCADLSAV